LLNDVGDIRFDSYNEVVCYLNTSMKKLVIHLVLEDFQYDARINKMTQSLHKFGIQNIVLAVWRRGLERETIRNSILIKRFNIPGYDRGSLIRTCFGYIIYIIKSLYNIARLRPSVIHCHNLTVSIPVLIMKFFKPKLKYVYDSHELFTETNQMRKRANWIRKIASGVEKQFASKASAVIQTTIARAEFFENKYSVKAEVISNFPSVSYASHPNCFNAPNLREKFQIPVNAAILVYVGSVIKGRGLEQICKIINDDPMLHFVVLGRAIAWGYNFINKVSKLKNFHYHEPVEPRKVTQTIKGANCGICLIENTCLSYYYSKPTKLFEYIYAGIPVLGSNFPEIEKVVFNGGHRLGEVVNPDDIISIRNTISRILNSHCPEKDFEAARNRYCWEKQEDKIRKIYNEVL